MKIEHIYATHFSLKRIYFIATAKKYNRITKIGVPIKRETYLRRKSFPFVCVSVLVCFTVLYIFTTSDKCILVDFCRNKGAFSSSFTVVNNKSCPSFILRS